MFRFPFSAAHVSASMQRISVWLLPIESDTWLTFLRVGLGIQIAAFCLSLRADWNNLFGDLLSRDLAEKILSLESPFIPRLGWIAAFGKGLGLSEEIVLWMVWSGLLLAGCALLVGIAPRFFAALAWLLHLSLTKSGAFLSYGLDNFITIGLFYLTLSPLPDQWSLDARWRKSRPQDRHLLGFSRRVLQLHLCFIYFFGGLSKILGSGWWDGSNLWRALIRPPFDVLAPETLVRWKYVFPLAGIAIALLEFSYPCLIWAKRTRNLGLFCVCSMHAAIGLAMGMYLFAFVMIVLNVAAFAPEALFLKSINRLRWGGGHPGKAEASL